MSEVFDVYCYVSLKSGNILSPMVKTVRFQLDITTFTNFEKDLRQRAISEARKLHGPGEYVMIKIVMNKQ